MKSCFLFTHHPSSTEWFIGWCPFTLWPGLGTWVTIPTTKSFAFHFPDDLKTTFETTLERMLKSMGRANLSSKGE
jgi:hypothetical protein